MDAVLAPVGRSRRMSVADTLVSLTAAMSLWHDGDKAYASFTVDDHVEHWPVRSGTFRSLLARLYWGKNIPPRAPSSQAKQDALAVIEGQALYDGGQRTVHVRLAEHDGKLFLDLADDRWRAVEISALDWRVIDRAPAMFERRPGMEPLPIPLRGGSLNQLRPFINLTDIDWVLALGWLVGAFNLAGPHALLAIFGEQGSGKSTLARVLRRLIDPNRADLRSRPTDARDLMIAARNGLVCAFDNLSGLRPGLSDDLARLATGAGFSTRTLYTDDDETLIQACRPVIVNGIEDFVTRPDLLDRAVVIRPHRLTKHRTEREYWTAFERARAEILGALLTAVSTALYLRDTVRLPSTLRMADFARWVVAAEPALPIPHGAFIAAYHGNRRDSHSLALDADPVAQAIATFIEETGEWVGPAGELANRLAPERPAKDWPMTGQAMAGALRRAAPILRGQGYGIDYDETARPRVWRLGAKDTDTTDGADERFAVYPSGECQSPVNHVTPPVEDEIPESTQDAASVDLVSSVSSESAESVCPRCDGEGCRWCTR